MQRVVILPRGFRVHIPYRQYALHFVVRAQEECGLFCLHGSALVTGTWTVRAWTVRAWTNQAGMVQHDFMGIARDSAMRGEQGGSIRSAERDMNLGRQREHVRFPGILHPHGPASRLRGAEIYPGIGRSIPAVLVEDQVF